MFERTELLIGKENIKNIKNTSVLLIGVGGVGGYAFESLVRAGIGTIIIVDSDTYDETNLNRQLHATIKSVGKNKVDVLKERAKIINSNCNVITINKFIDDTNYNDLFAYNPDYVIDAIDCMKTKKLIIKKCLKEKIKIISSMGMGGKVDASKVKIMKIKDTSYDPIAREIRNFIKKEKLSDKLMVVSSSEKSVITKPVGTISYMPAISGLLLTNFVINDILKKGDM